MTLNQLTNIKKLFFLGIAVASTKVMLLLFAYFFDAEIYNQFNQIYYTASIIILFGSLGFNIAVTRLKIGFKLVYGAVAINAILVYLLLQIVSSPFNNFYEIASILLYSIFISITGIFVFHLLFSGRYKDYVLLTLLYSALHLLIIPAILFLKVSLFAVLPVVSLLWFSIGFPKYIKQNNSSVKLFGEFYKIGISAFVINSAVSLALAADKYFVNHFFNLEVANSYTFAWGLTAPMFYIGVIIEQFLFSEANPSKSNILKRGLVLSTAFVIIYAVTLLVVINLFPGLLPESVNSNYVLNIVSLMISGYSLYIIFHFPVNAYLFKSLGTEKQKSISIIFSIIIFAFVILYGTIMQGVIEINYLWLLIITWSYIFTLLITKIFIMFRKPAEEELLSPVSEITNLEP
ncbi:MAG TPA: hypothetical protein VLH59_01310 [Ignavibacteriaceae bacterium]|nr:hypothetical protein [Ignavibacteriaceae bacterium]